MWQDVVLFDGTLENDSASDGLIGRTHEIKFSSPVCISSVRVGPAVPATTVDGGSATVGVRLFSHDTNAACAARFQDLCAEVVLDDAEGCQEQSTVDVVTDHVVVRGVFQQLRLCMGGPASWTPEEKSETKPDQATISTSPAAPPLHLQPRDRFPEAELRKPMADALSCALQLWHASRGCGLQPASDPGATAKQQLDAPTQTILEQLHRQRLPRNMLCPSSADAAPERPVEEERGKARDAAGTRLLQETAAADGGVALPGDVKLEDSLAACEEVERADATPTPALLAQQGLALMVEVADTLLPEWLPFAASALAGEQCEQRQARGRIAAACLLVLCTCREGALAALAAGAAAQLAQLLASPQLPCSLLRVLCGAAELMLLAAGPVAAEALLGWSLPPPLLPASARPWPRLCPPGDATPAADGDATFEPGGEECLPRRDQDPLPAADVVLEAVDEDLPRPNPEPASLPGAPPPAACESAAAEPQPAASTGTPDDDDELLDYGDMLDDAMPDAGSAGDQLCEADGHAGSAAPAPASLQHGSGDASAAPDSPSRAPSTSGNAFDDRWAPVDAVPEHAAVGRPPEDSRAEAHSSANGMRTDDRWVPLDEPTVGRDVEERAAPRMLPDTHPDGAGSSGHGSKRMHKEKRHSRRERSGDRERDGDSKHRDRERDRENRHRDRHRDRKRSRERRGDRSAEHGSDRHRDHGGDRDRDRDRHRDRDRDRDGERERGRDGERRRDDGRERRSRESRRKRRRGDEGDEDGHHRRSRRRSRSRSKGRSGRSQPSDDRKARAAPPGAAKTSANTAEESANSNKAEEGAEEGQHRLESAAEAKPSSAAAAAADAAPNGRTPGGLEGELAEPRTSQGTAAEEAAKAKGEQSGQAAADAAAEAAGPQVEVSAYVSLWRQLSRPLPAELAACILCCMHRLSVYDILCNVQEEVRTLPALCGSSPAVAEEVELEAAKPVVLRCADLLSQLNQLLALDPSAFLADRAGRADDLRQVLHPVAELDAAAVECMSALLLLPGLAALVNFCALLLECSADAGAPGHAAVKAVSELLSQLVALLTLLTSSEHGRRLLCHDPPATQHLAQALDTCGGADPASSDDAPPHGGPAVAFRLRSVLRTHQAASQLLAHAPGQPAACCPAAALLEQLMAPSQECLAPLVLAGCPGAVDRLVAGLPLCSSLMQLLLPDPPRSTPGSPGRAFASAEGYASPPALEAAASPAASAGEEQAATPQAFEEALVAPRVLLELMRCPDPGALFSWMPHAAAVQTSAAQQIGPCCAVSAASATARELMELQGRSEAAELLVCQGWQPLLQQAELLIAPVVRHLPTDGHCKPGSTSAGDAAASAGGCAEHVTVAEVFSVARSRVTEVMKAPNRWGFLHVTLALLASQLQVPAGSSGCEQRHVPAGATLQQLLLPEGLLQALVSAGALPLLQKALAFGLGLQSLLRGSQQWAVWGGDALDDAELCRLQHAAQLLLVAAAAAFCGLLQHLMRLQTPAPCRITALHLLFEAHATLCTSQESLECACGQRREGPLLRTRQLVAATCVHWLHSGWDPPLLTALFRPSALNPLFRFRIAQRSAAAGAGAEPERDGDGLPTQTHDRREAVAPSAVFTRLSLLGDLLPREWPPVGLLASSGFPPPGNRRLRSALAQAMEPVQEDFMRLVELGVASDSALVRAAVVRCACRAAGLGAPMGLLIALPALRQLQALLKNPSQPGFLLHLHHLLTAMSPLLLRPALKAHFQDQRVVRLLSQLLQLLLRRRAEEDAATLYWMVLEVLRLLCTADAGLHTAAPQQHAGDGLHLRSRADLAVMVTSLLECIVQMPSDCAWPCAIIQDLAQYGPGRAAVQQGAVTWSSTRRASARDGEPAQLTLEWAAEFVAGLAGGGGDGPDDAWAADCRGLSELLQQLAERAAAGEQGAEAPAATLDAKQLFVLAVQASMGGLSNPLDSETFDVEQERPAEMVLDAAAAAFWRYWRARPLGGAQPTALHLHQVEPQQHAAAASALFSSKLVEPRRPRSLPPLSPLPSLIRGIPPAPAPASAPHRAADGSADNDRARSSCGSGSGSGPAGPLSEEGAQEDIPSIVAPRRPRKSGARSGRGLSTHVDAYQQRPPPEDGPAGQRSPTANTEAAAAAMPLPPGEPHTHAPQRAVASPADGPPPGMPGPAALQAASPHAQRHSSDDASTPFNAQAAPPQTAAEDDDLEAELMDIYGETEVAQPPAALAPHHHLPSRSTSVDPAGPPAAAAEPLGAAKPCRPSGTMPAAAAAPPPAAPPPQPQPPQPPRPSASASVAQTLSAVLHDPKRLAELLKRQPELRKKLAAQMSSRTAAAGKPSS